jgi:hypothetical protein
VGQDGKLIPPFSIIFRSIATIFGVKRLSDASPTDLVLLAQCVDKARHSHCNALDDGDDASASV